MTPWSASAGWCYLLWLAAWTVVAMMIFRV